MKHPLYTYNDGTEVTASSVKDGKVRVFTERWDNDRDMFVNAEIVIPDGIVLSQNGYSEADLNILVERYKKLSADIIEYVLGPEDSAPSETTTGVCLCI